MRSLIGPVVIGLVCVPVLLFTAQSWRNNSIGHLTSSGKSEVRADVKETLKTEGDFNISPGTLPGQLQEMFDSRQVSYFYMFSDVENIRGNPVHGRFTLSTALHGLLNGTGCVYHESEKTLAIACEEAAAEPGHIASSR